MRIVFYFLAVATIFLVLEVAVSDRPPVSKRGYHNTTIQFTPSTNSSYPLALPDTFVITGDIDAMWLRDTVGQLKPYSKYLSIDDDGSLHHLFRGAIRRMTQNVNIDPFANAFNKGPTGQPGKDWQQDTRTPPMQPFLWEGKYELDSLANTLDLFFVYFNETNGQDLSPFLPTSDEDWQFGNAITSIINVITIMQNDLRTEAQYDNAPYKFYRSDFILDMSVGYPSQKNGMSRSPFRPSDDPTVFGYLVPSNALAVVALKNIALLLDSLALHTTGIGALSSNLVQKSKDLSQKARSLSNEIKDAIEKYGVVNTGTETRYVYECDGFGNTLSMDDPNQPSLLSLPIFGYTDVSNPIYQATRKWILSDKNPFFFRATSRNETVGVTIEGLGSPHNSIGMVWPMSIITRALTSTDPSEIMDQLKMLQASDAGTFFMHEAFSLKDPGSFSRPWFSWANSLFGQLIIKVVEEYPSLLQ